MTPNDERFQQEGLDEQLAALARTESQPGSTPTSRAYQSLRRFHAAQAEQEAQSLQRVRLRLAARAANHRAVRESERAPAPNLALLPLPAQPSRHVSWLRAVLGTVAAVFVIALLTVALVASHHSSGQAATPVASATATPAQSDSSGVYFASEPVTLYALKAQDGSLRWKKNLPASIEGGLVVSDGSTLYVLTVDAQNKTAVAADAVYAVNPSDGAIRWYTPIGAQSLVLKVSNGVVYTSTFAGDVLALNASDGSILWQTKLENGEAAVQLISSGVLYASVLENSPNASSGSLYALNAADGAVRWHAQLHGYPSAISIVDGQLDTVARYAQEGANEATLSTTSTFYALDASTGAQHWSYTGAVSTDMNMAGADADAVYLTIADSRSDSATVLALNAGNGSVRWQKSSPYLYGSLLSNNTMYLALEGGIAAISLLDGSPIWNIPLSIANFDSMGADGTLYVTAATALYALDGSTGSVKWIYQGFSPLVRAVLHGVLYGWSGRVAVQGNNAHSIIFALDASSGKQRWKYDLAAPVTAPVLS